MTHQLTDPAANAILDRIRTFGYRVDVFRSDAAPAARRGRQLEVHAADARTGEHHVVTAAAGLAGGEFACVCALADLVASELEG